MGLAEGRFVGEVVWRVTFSLGASEGDSDGTNVGV